MKRLTTDEGKFARFEMSEDEYLDLVANDLGLCVSCGSERDCVEPDAERYPCEECGSRKVYGVEQLMLLGRLALREARL
jgi:hypothetical protein